LTQVKEFSYISKLGSCEFLQMDFFLQRKIIMKVGKLAF